MLVARKGNKEVYVDETSKARYLNDGYSVYEDGELIECGRGAAIALPEYLKVVKENEALKAELAELKAKKTRSSKK